MGTGESAGVILQSLHLLTAHSFSPAGPLDPVGSMARTMGVEDGGTCFVEY